MVEVGGFEGGDTTFLTLENITAVAFDDAYDNRDPAPALLFHRVVQASMSLIVFFILVTA